MKNLKQLFFMIITLVMTLLLLGFMTILNRDEKNEIEKIVVVKMKSVKLLKEVEKVKKKSIKKKIKEKKIKKIEKKVKKRGEKKVIEKKVVVKKSIIAEKKIEIKEKIVVVKEKIEEELVKKELVEISSESVVVKVEEKKVENILKTEKKDEIREEVVETGEPLERVEISSLKEGIDYKIKSKRLPKYPIRAKKLRYKKDVVVICKIYIGYSGEVERVEILDGLEKFGFNREVVRVVERYWSFEPIFYKGKPIKASFVKPFRFKSK